MRLTGSAKSTQKRGAMAPRRTHYPQILFLEKKDPWGTVSGLENPLPFLGYLSHTVLYRISKCTYCTLCNNGMFAPIWWGVLFGNKSLGVNSLLTYQLKYVFVFFVCIRLACCLCSSFHGRRLFLPVKFHFSLPRFAAYHCVFSTCGLYWFVHTNPSFSNRR